MKSFGLRNRDGAVEDVPLEGTCSGGPGNFVWLHLDGSDEASRAWLERESTLPDAATRALIARETRPRLEVLEDGALVNLRGLAADEPGPDDMNDALVSIRMWAEKGRVISVGYRALSALAPAVAHMRGGRIHDPGDLIAFLAGAITAALDPEVAGLGDSLDDCEAQLDVRQSFAMRRQIANARGKAIEYRRFVVPQRQAVENLAVLQEDWIEEEDRVHLREAADRVARMAEELEAVRERAALLHEQLTDLRAEQIDNRSLLISVVALVFLPLTFLTGLLGMNVEGIPFAHAPWAFDGVVALCVVIAAVISGYFAMAHWFRG